MTVYGDMSASKGYAASKYKVRQNGKWNYNFNFEMRPLIVYPSVKLLINCCRNKRHFWWGKNPQSLQANARMVPSLGLVHCLPYPLCFSTHISSTFRKYVVHLQTITWQRPIISLREERKKGKKKCNKVKLSPWKSFLEFREAYSSTSPWTHH
jgi:hypothetical protein